MTDQDLIKLAEFCGECPKDHGDYQTFNDWDKCHKCGIRYEDAKEHQFDPYTDANDCEALIRALIEQGYAVVVYHGGANRVTIYDYSIDDGSDQEIGRWQGDDYKIGVCELALKVIADTREQINE